MLVSGDEFEGLTIKKILFDRLGFSRAVVTALKKRADGISVNGEHKTVRYVLKKGDSLVLETADTESSVKIRPCAGEIDILYEDDCFLCVNKPAHMAVHPSKKLQDDTLAGRVVRLRSPMVFRAAGRLDKDTSGAVLCSKDKVTASRFSDLILHRQIHKEYLLLAESEKTPPSSGKIALCIRRDPESYIKRVCFEPDGSQARSEEAETSFCLLYSAAPYHLFLAAPVTGRTHQLRAHFSAIGFPIAGDTLYGAPSEIIPRQALHAFRLAFRHPVTGDVMRLTAPLHEDFLSALKAAFGEDFNFEKCLSGHSGQNQ